MAKILEYPLISCSSLLTLLSEPSHNIQLLYLSPNPFYTSPKIPTSIFFSLSTLSSIESFVQELEDCEIQNDSSLVVCYENEGVERACEVWWKLIALGKISVLVLEGGYASWASEIGEEAEIQPRSPLKVGAGRFTLQPDRYITLKDIRPYTARAKQQLVNTDSMYEGYTYFNTTLLFNYRRELKSPASLKEAISNSGITLTEDIKTVVFGAKACLLLLALCSLGKCNISLGDSQSKQSTKQAQMDLMMTSGRGEFLKAIDDSDLYDYRGDLEDECRVTVISDLSLQTNPPEQVASKQSTHTELKDRTDMYYEVPYGRKESVKPNSKAQKGGKPSATSTKSCANCAVY